MRMTFHALAAACVSLTLLVHTSTSATPAVRWDHRFEELREKLQIPGLSAVVVKDRKVVWAKGFGYADLEKRVSASGSARSSK